MSKNLDVSRGKLSTIILSTLSSGDKYGYEIVSEIERQTNGAISIKQPSLYSSLKRMEDQDLISSYWMDSEIGGRRHYYRLTDFGKKHLEEWQADFDISSLASKPETKEVEIPTEEQQPQPTFLQQENLFDINNNEQTEITTPKKDDAVLLKRDSFIQYDLFDKSTQITQANYDKQDNIVSNVQPPIVQSPIEQKVSNEDNSNLVDNKTQTQEDYDIFAELDLFKNSNKSFSGAMSTSKPKTDYHNNTLESFMGESYVMNELDNSISDSNFNLTNTSLSDTFDDISYQEDQKQAYSTIEIKNEDSRFITERYSEDEMPKAKRIEPPIIDVFSSSKIDTSRLEKSQEFKSYDEKIGELYSKNNSNLTAEETTAPLTISNYTNLKKYFDEQKIYFGVYVKSDKNKTTQTSLVSDFKFSLIRYSMTLLSIIISLLICGLTISKLSHIQNAALTLYILPPILYLLCAGYIVYSKSKNKDRKILLMETNKIQIAIKIAICVIICVLVYLFNLAGGLNSTNFNDYTNTMIVPFILALHFPLTTLYSYLTTKFKCIK